MTHHPSRQPRSRRPRIGLAVVATLALLISACTGSALAAPGSGEVVLSLNGKANGSLLGQGVKASASKTGKATKVATRTVALPVVDLDLLGAATIRTSGAVKLSNGKKRATLRELIVQSAGEQTAISAKLGKRRLIVFRAQGAGQIGASSFSLAKASLSLTGKGADALGARLGLEDLAGKQGTLSAFAQLPTAETPKPAQPSPKQPDPIVDPYKTQCALDVTTKATGAAAGPADAPDLSSPAAATGGKVDWGFKESFRNYIHFSGGANVPIAPAEVLNPPLPAPQTGSFRFPAGSGQYAIGEAADSSDDQAILEGEGEVVLCNAPHGFRIVLSDPTVTIDGEESRLTVDVDTNMSGIWTPTQRVDLATLDLDGVSPFYNEDAKKVTWSNLPAALTEAGSEALQLCNPNAPGPCEYEEGDALDALTLELSTAAGVAWPFGSACTVGSPATASAWPSTPAGPLALPALTGPEEISDGSINWGLRNSLRTTVNSNGVFNLSGTTRSDPTDMSGAGKFFTWPAVEGEYESGTPGRLVLHGSGSVGICNTTHGYGAVLANPTVVIDGANSRLTMDVASRIGVSWTSGRVDVATLTGTAVEKTTTPGPEVDEETVTWTFPDLGADNAIGGGDDDTDSANSSVKLSTAGASALALINLKTAGTSLNKLSVSIVHPAP